MTLDEMEARLLILEAAYTTAGGLFLLNDANGWDPGNAAKMLGAVREIVRRRLSEIEEPDVVRLGENYLEVLLEELSKRFGSHARRSCGEM